MGQLTEVRVRHTGLNTDYKMLVRQDRLDAFRESVLGKIRLYAQRVGEPEINWETRGVSGAAVVGMNTIFTQIPNKFPVADILRFLTEYVGGNYDMVTVEYWLGAFGMNNPGITGDGSDVE